MYIADTLSRAFITSEKAYDNIGFESINIINQEPMSSDRLKDIREETANDNTLQELETVIRSG